MCIFQVKLDHSPQFAFGIKHSPYLGSLRGDAWGGSKSEAMGIASRYKVINMATCVFFKKISSVHQAQSCLKFAKNVLLLCF